MGAAGRRYPASLAGPSYPDGIPSPRTLTQSGRSDGYYDATAAPLRTGSRAVSERQRAQCRGSLALRWRLHSSGISPIDFKISRHVSEQLSSPTCSAHPSGRGSPRRTWAYRLHCAQRMVTSPTGSVMAALLLVSVQAVVSYWTAETSG